MQHITRLQDEAMALLDYERPQMILLQIPTGLSLLETFSLEGEFENFEDEGDL